MTNGRRLLIAFLTLAAAATLAAGAAAATKPTAITGPVTATGSTTATLTGTVNPNGDATTWYFEYGKTTGYGTKTATQNAGSGTADVAASASVTGLTPNTTYHYRLVATNSAGTNHGTDGIFTTSTAVEAVTNAATNVTSSSATLNGSVNPFGRATTWYFEYGTSTNYGSKTSLQSAGSGTSSVAVSAPVSGLSVGKTYHFRIVAMNTAGTAFGHDATFSTGTAPSAVTQAASSVGPTSATLNGTVNPNGQSTTWWFDYGTTSSYGSSTSTHNAGSGTSASSQKVTLTSLAPGTTYHFRIVAKNASGTSHGADQSFTTTGITINASALAVLYGGGTTLSGTVSNGAAGETVTLLERQFGETSFHSIVTLVSASGGTWSYLAHPRIRTEYEAMWKGALSSTVAVGVHPVVTIRALSGRRFSVHVIAARSFVGHSVKLQRRSALGQWVTVGVRTLSSGSIAVFHPTLPKGVSHLRAVISVNQAGAGYLGGTSRTISYRRR